MPPSLLALQEPVINAMVTLLTANLNTEIEAINALNADPYSMALVEQFLPFVPVASTLIGGLPAVGVQEISSEFEDDTQFSMNAQHQYAVVAIVQNVDHQTLAIQLRRMMGAIANVIQADRLLGNAAGAGGIMRDQGGVMSVRFIRTEPGPLLGDLDPQSPEAPPRSYLSWSGILFASGRVEVE